jgi:hypothetical protein
MGRRVKRSWLAAATAALLLPPAALGAGFDDPVSRDPSQQFGARPGALPTIPPATPTNVQRQDTPNDPQYDNAEFDTQQPADKRSTNLFDERFDLFGFPSALTETTARYKDPDDPNRGKAQVSGFNAAGAWKITRGDPNVNVAILDTGINWDDAALRNQVALNGAELPAPTGNDGNGILSVDDFKDDPKVKAITGAREPTAQDLINAYSDRVDDGGNGYIDDIAGWDFFDNDNDPQDTSSYFAAENHGSGRVGEVVEPSNDGKGALGVCPKCQFTPLRVWDTFVSDQNNFFTAALYAADNGVEVIEGADGGLYHSAFSERASQYVYEKGLAQVYSGDDLNTANHNFPANYNHTMLIEGTSADVKGIGKNAPAAQRGDPGFRAAAIEAARLAKVGTEAPVQTYFRSSNTAQFGGHSSISMEGATGSVNTGKGAGAVALVISAARQLNPPIYLSADESRELLEQTAEDVLPANTLGTGVPDPAQKGFDTHFGYGRANLGEAVREASARRIPPEASIGSPDWYAPLTGATAPVTGLAKARSGVGAGAFTWKLEYGVGLAPTSFTELRTGSSPTGQAVTDFGALPLAQIRAALAARNTFQDRDDPAGPLLDKSSRKLDPFQGQFTVQLTVTSSNGTVKKGVDRKVLTALPDGQSLRPGFPKRLGTGGEAPLRYADLDGDNTQELVLPTEDGLMHAFRPDGSELPGWPVKTRQGYVASGHGDAPGLKALKLETPSVEPLEPPRAPTVADLTGDGRPEVITTAGERIYVWKADGSELGGWPVRPDPGRLNCAVSEQKKAIKHPKCGFLASPAVARLDGRAGPLSIVVPGLDGRLRAYHSDGSEVPGFPVRLIDPDEVEKMTAESINQLAIGDLDNDGSDDIVAADNEVYGGAGGASPTGGDVGFGGALSTAPGTSSRVYAVHSAGNSAPGGKPFFPGWPIKLPGLIQDVLPLIGPGHDPALVKVGGEQQIVVSTTGGALTLFGVDGKARREMRQNGGGADGGALNLFESAAVGALIDPAKPDIVKYQIDLTQAANLLLVGQNAPYSHRIGAFDATSGETASPDFPVITDDYQFLSSSTVAKVDPASPANAQVLAGTGLGLLHAYDGVTGLDSPGFPKVTGGWLFAPAALSNDGRIASITREGYLFEWAQATPACQTEWPSFRHDQQATGNYDADGTPPAAPERVALAAIEGDRYKLTFRSPGDDAFCGTANRYVADIDGQALDLGKPVAGGADFAKEITLPAGATKVTIRAADGPVDGRSNLGAPASVDRAAAAPAPAPPASGSTGTTTPGPTGDRPGTPAGPGSGTPATGGGAVGGGSSPAGGGAGCTPGAPKVTFTGTRVRLTRSRAALRGNALDAVCKATAIRSVRVAVGLPKGHQRCAFLLPTGRLSKPRSCGKPLFLKARVRSTGARRAAWSVSLRGRLARGRYIVLGRATDAGGATGPARRAKLRPRVR